MFEYEYVSNPIKKSFAILRIKFIIQKLTKSFKKLSKPKTQEESKDDIIKNIRNLFKLKKEIKPFKAKRINDIRNLFELENKDYYKTIRVCNFYCSSYIEYKCNSDKDKNLSVGEYLKRIKPYSKDIIIDLQISVPGKFNQKSELTLFLPKIPTKNKQCI